MNRKPEYSGSEFVKAAICSYDDHRSLPEPLRSELIASDNLALVADKWMNQDTGLAILMVQGIIEKIELLYLAGSNIVSVARQWHERENNWEERHRQAVQKLKEALELLSPHQSTSTETDQKQRISLDHINIGDIEQYAGMGTLNVILAKIAKEIETNDVRPLREKIPCPIPQSSIGSRGRAAIPDKAIKGIAVNEVHRLLPASMKKEYALVASLVRLTGLEMSRQNARSIILKGKT